MGVGGGGVESVYVQCPVLYTTFCKMSGDFFCLKLKQNEQSVQQNGKTFFQFSCSLFEPFLSESK